MLRSGDEAATAGQVLKGVATEPRSLSRVDLEVSLFDATTFGSAVALLGSDGDGDSAVVTVVDPLSGDILWEEDGDAIVGVGDSLAIAVGEKIQLWSQAGEPVGDDLKVGDPVVDLSLIGDTLIATRDSSDVIIDLQTWTIISRDVGAVSSNGRWAVETDIRKMRTRVQLLDLRSGERVGERFILDWDFADFAVLDDGGIAVLSDGEVTILDSDGTTRSSINVSDSAVALQSTLRNYISVTDGSASVVLRFDGETIDELSPDVDGALTLVEINGDVHGLTLPIDDEVNLYSITNDTLSFLFDANAFLATATDHGVYVADEDELSYLAVPGRGRPDWTLSTDGFFYWVDGYILEINAEVSSYQTDIEIYG